MNSTSVRNFPLSTHNVTLCRALRCNARQAHVDVDGVLCKSRLWCRGLACAPLPHFVATSRALENPRLLSQLKARLAGQRSRRHCSQKPIAPAAGATMRTP